MTHLALALAALLLVATLAVVLRRVRHHLPSPDAPSNHYADLAEGLHRAREESVSRTRALNAELEMMRRKGHGHGR